VNAAKDVSSACQHLARASDIRLEHHTPRGAEGKRETRRDSLLPVSSKAERQRTREERARERERDVGVHERRILLSYELDSPLDLFHRVRRSRGHRR
jgi:hypothetical protein